MAMARPAAVSLGTFYVFTGAALSVDARGHICYIMLLQCFPM